MASMLENISLAKADMIIANSPQTQRYLLAERKIKPEKVRLVTEVRIDLDKFKYTPSDVRSSYGIPADAKMIFFNGWLQARKGVHFLCEAMPQIIKQFPGAVLVLLGRDTMSAPGGGSFKKYILDHAARHAYADKLKIIDTYVSDEELVKLYSACDVFVLPSLAETFGWPTIEALACGRPVVSSRTGIITEFEGQSPLIKLTPIGSTDELAQAIVDMLSIPDAQIVELSPALRQLVENNFSFVKMVTETAAVYEETIKQWKKK
jgi:glycosyltransferase involved in cell wall biosynthesis